MSVMVIEVQRVRGGYIATEDHWQSLVYPKKAHAINHARVRARFRGPGEIRIYDDAGVIEHTTLFFPQAGKRKGGEQ